MLLTFALTLTLLAADEGDDARAKAFVRGAQRSFQASKFKEAIEQFEAAMALRPRPALHYNVARCHESLNEVAPAMREYREYLRLAPDATDRGVVQEVVTSLEARLAQQGLRQVQLVVEPLHAKLNVDGNPSTLASPFYVELAPGPHTFTLTADGFEQVERAITLEAVRSVQLIISLRPTSDAPVVKPEPAVQPAAVLEPVAPPPTMPPVVAAAGRPKIFTWVAGGTAVAGAGVATAFGLAANGSANELVKSIHTRAEGDALVAQTKDFATGANVAWAVAGTAMVVGVVLFFVENP